MSQYTQNSEGTFIPATKRPDGTWRKARRVKDGYVPQEEVPLYESKGKQFVQRQNGLPPGMCPIIAENAKKEKEKRERAKLKKTLKATGNPDFPVLPTPATSAKAPAPTPAPNTPNPKQPSVKSIEVLTEKLDENLSLYPQTLKQLKKYRKKIREIEAIESKLKSGEFKQLDKDQVEKLGKKAEILKQIKILEEEEEILQKNMPNTVDCS